MDATKLGDGLGVGEEFLGAVEQVGVDGVIFGVELVGPSLLSSLPFPFSSDWFSFWYLLSIARSRASSWTLC